jgi:hypothetical protein
MTAEQRDDEVYVTLEGGFQIRKGERVCVDSHYLPNGMLCPSTHALVTRIKGGMIEEMTCDHTEDEHHGSLTLDGKGTVLDRIKAAEEEAEKRRRSYL